MNPTREKLLTIFAAPGWSRFVETLASYRERGQPLPAAVTLSDPTGDERRHHARLLRLPTSRSAGTLRYDLAKIATALQIEHSPVGWEEVLYALCGSISTERLTARVAKREWQSFWPQAADLLEERPFPASDEWLEWLRGGALKRLSSGDVVFAKQLIETSVHLLRALPLSEDQPLAGVASRYGASSHALDHKTVLSTLVLRGLALRQDQPAPSRSDERRELWGAFRVVCDELSAPTLTFNLALGGDSLLPRLVALASVETQPIHLTSRQLWAADWSRIACPPTVFACENPTVVSMAANILGRVCPPLVCVDGEPKTATRLLLRRLEAGGSALFYHGDFDWPGIAIAGRILREFGARPWCFDADAYHLAATHQGRPLTGNPVPTPWSPKLADAMLQAGIAYDEELLADELLLELSKAGFAGQS